VLLRHATMRLKQRFYLCQLHLDPSLAPAAAAAQAAALTSADIYTALRTVIQEAFGDVGLGAASPLLAVKFYSPVTRLCVVRGATACHTQTHAALALTKAVKKQPAAIQVLQVCGCPRTLREAATHWQSSIVSAAKTASAGVEGLLDAAFFAALDAELGDAI